MINAINSNNKILKKSNHNKTTIFRRKKAYLIRINSFISKKIKVKIHSIPLLQNTVN